MASNTLHDRLQELERKPAGERTAAEEAERHHLRGRLSDTSMTFVARDPTMPADGPPRQPTRNKTP